MDVLAARVTPARFPRPGSSLPCTGSGRTRRRHDVDPHRALGPLRHARQLGASSRRNGTFSNHDPERRARPSTASRRSSIRRSRATASGRKIYVGALQGARPSASACRASAAAPDCASYHRHARRMSRGRLRRRAVVHGAIVDHTLSFQLHEGFHVLAVVPRYLSDDSETLGYAALIEWLNPASSTRSLRRTTDALPAPRRRAAVEPALNPVAPTARRPTSAPPGLRGHAPEGAAHRMPPVC